MAQKQEKNNLIVMGKRVLVKIEKLDTGGLNMSPTTEATGEKNKGTIVAVGSIWFAWFRGIKKGATIVFKKHFVANHEEGQEQMVFVDLDSILAIEK